MANQEKKAVTMTTAYRQNNYLIVDNKPNSVSVTVYFRMSNKQILKPNFKSKIRSLKNSVHKYDEGQILIRELTSDTNLLPKKAQLTQLVHYLLKYEGLTDIATFKILWKRLTDYQTLRHVEKSLLVIQHLLSQKHPFYSHAFERYCMDRKIEFIKLQNYHYKIDSSDIGKNVRDRALNIYQTLFKPQNIINICQNDDIGIASIPLPRPKKPKKPHKHKKKHSKKKKSKTKLVNEDEKGVEIEDLLSLDSNDFQGTCSNNNINNNTNDSFWNNNSNGDIFDIFGELPSNEHVQNNNDNEYQDFLSCSTSTSGMIVNNNNNTRDFNFPVTF